MRQSASKEELAKEIASIKKMSFEGLDTRALVTLAQLRGLPANEQDARADLEARVRASEPIGDLLNRKRILHPCPNAPRDWAVPPPWTTSLTRNLTG